MKKIIVSIMLISSIGWALLGGAGLYGLQDQFAIPADSVMGFSLDDDGTIYGDLIRTEMKQPIGLGGFAYVDILPIDLEIFGEIAFSSYEYQFRTFVAANEWLDDLPDPMEFLWMRYSYGFTARKPVFKLPMFRINFGAGVNMTGVLPIVDENYIIKLGNNQPQDQTELEEHITDEIKTRYAGAHIQIGAQFKPLMIPFALHANARYTYFMSEGVLPDKKGFLNLWMGLAFHL